MHDTFVFPMDCMGQLNKWDDHILFFEVPNIKGKVMHGMPKEFMEFYNPFDFNNLIPEFIKMIEKVLNGENLKKNIKKWLTEWGPLYTGADFENNTVERFWQECDKFYKLWNFYKAIANNDKENLMNKIKVEEKDDHFKLRFFPDDPTFPREGFIVTEENKHLVELGLHDPEDVDFTYTFRIGKKKDDEFLKEIRNASLFFFFKQVEGYTARANLTWDTMREEKKENRSKFKIEPVLEVENLIDAIYLQFYILFSENEKKICPVCNTPFVPQRKDKKYCSETCKLTAKSRRYRARKDII